MNVITNSRIRARRDCAKKHHLAYVAKVRPTNVPEALRFGTLMHVGLAEWWRDGLKAALDALETEESDPNDLARARQLMHGYDRAHAEERHAFEVIGVEVPFEIPLLNPDTMAASRAWRLGGKIDVLLREKATGHVAVMEHKTTSEDFSDDAAEYLVRLGMDPQISTYVLAAESLGYRVADTVYDIVGKPQLRPLKATPEEARKYTKPTKTEPSRLYAGQRETDETVEEYEARVALALLQNPARYFAWKRVPRLESQVREFMADAWDMAAIIREDGKNDRAPRNPDACFRYGRCPYWSICAYGVNPMNSPDYRIADVANEELV